MFEVCLQAGGDPSAVVAASREVWSRLREACEDTYNVGAWGLAACGGVLVTISYWEPGGIGRAPAVLVKISSPPDRPGETVRVASEIAATLRSTLGRLGYVTLYPSCPTPSELFGKLPY